MRVTLNFHPAQLSFSSSKFFGSFYLGAPFQGCGHVQRDSGASCALCFLGVTVLKNKHTPAEFLRLLDSEREREGKALQFGE